MERAGPVPTKDIQTCDGSVVSFQKNAVAVLASLAVFFQSTLAVLMRLF